MTSNRVLISGASVAGPALAFWLRRYGFTPTVVERAPELRDGGYAVDFRGASLDVLDRMGLLGAVEAAATRMGEVTYVDGQDRPLVVTPPTYQSGELEILRGDLSRILYDATKDDVEYVFGDSITGITERGDGITVTFAHGEPREFDLVIGADGLHSNVRSLVFGDERRFRHDLGYYVSICTVPNHLALDHVGRFHNEPNRTVGVYSARDNSEAKALFWFGADRLDYDHRDVGQQRRIVEERFAGVGWETPALVDAMRAAPDFYFDSASQIKLDSYARGRVALVGDAAYCAAPLSGMGTSLAVVGAYVLAGELASASYETAFAAYEREMRPFVDACQKLAEGNGKWFVPPTRAWLKFRNLTYRLLPYLPWRKLIEELPLKAGNAITLKQYAEVPV
ncbi:2-polyprenyl-6-methoxyphenol hydroxylase-like FAD-dependent oxidoreductase [Amycolatopsis lexingtonensis]|uniref:2-polyprenyl-6-methoxyphenol hydroxylase-like FAD-dependent oxidoreductase n=1 Tax=Amycolatopsis lexingtonensis TaxID=218822 RepID=A0ABR9I695_9PSEU|nr:FAD-dependent monooxygenase [Amycolatopsis lexingtonensis]MBE1498700.1 2-polyprenyl-6-methoxyphenol hydroxylase-like FAD-dependent oxidoreductase [Amycolatopsis lexingtonensis]